MKPLFLLLSILVIAPRMTQAESAPSEARRVEVLFMGAPTANHPAHNPIERYRVLKKAVGVDGINLTYSEDLTDFRRDVLDRFDAVLFYGNWKKTEAMEPSQEKALLGYVNDGGGFLPIHSASACFGGSPAFINLVGAHFKSHATGVFTTTIVAPEHPIMKSFTSFETWDETYVHDQLTSDRTVLQVRDQEPWTWVRNQGKGRVFYTAYGHDDRTWNQPAFQDLLRRAILWSINDKARASLAALKLPTLESEEMILPGYLEHKTITRGQKPLLPTESLKMAQVPNGFDISLFASEPNIVNPIHITWDDQGRAYVVETVDYPNNLQAGNLGHDRIHCCEDTDGDGKADKFTLFADHLSIPSSAVFVNGGLIVTNCTEMLFLKDTDGDGKADVRKVLFSGFNPADTHAGVSNLRYGFDNWIYATVGYAGFKGTVGGENFDFRMGVFRFKSDGSKLEFLQNTTNNTWGLGFTSDFDILGSTANGNPSWYYTFSKKDYDRAQLPQPQTPAGDSNPMYFPSSMDIRQVDQHDRYTAAAGHAFYTASRFPENYSNRIAFVCEPTGKLVGEFEVTPKDAGFTSTQQPNNLFSSADAWSGPVNAETGPDGAVWICDWYNLIIQHNPTPTVKSAGYDAKSGKGAAYESPIRDTSMGRIFRIFPNGSKNDVYPKLVANDPSTLVAALSHPNLFWRLQAQRLIVESGSSAIAAKLKEIIKTSPKENAAIHAFYALQGLNLLDDASINIALTSTNRGLRRAAIYNLPITFDPSTSLIKDGIIKSANKRELAETFIGLSRIAPSETLGKAIYKTLSFQREAILGETMLTAAWQTAARQNASHVILAATYDPRNATSAVPINLLRDPGFDGPDLGIWSLRNYKTEHPETVQLSISEGGRNGSKALKISSPSTADVGAGTLIKLKPNTTYRFGGWIRTEKHNSRGGKGAMFNVDGGSSSEALEGTHDWKEINFEFDSGNESEKLIHCLFGGYGGSVGTVFFDDVYLYEIPKGDIKLMFDRLVNYFSSTGNPDEKNKLKVALASRADEFSKSIVTTLSAILVNEKALVRKNTPDAGVHARGLVVYNRTCVACHGPEAIGVPGVFPPLDDSPIVTGDPSIPARILLHGLQGPIEVLGKTYNNVMPAHSDLSDKEISDVLTYVRQNWSNDAPEVTEQFIRKTREQFSTRKTAWTPAELLK